MLTLTGLGWQWDADPYGFGAHSEMLTHTETQQRGFGGFQPWRQQRTAVSSAQTETKGAFMGYKHCQDHRQPNCQRAPLDRDTDPQEGTKAPGKTTQTGSVRPKKGYNPTIFKPMALSP